MGQIQRGQDSEGIKLFGTTITLHGREIRNEDKNESEDGIEEKKPNKIIPCPRCKSMETKFCYFNNYNVNQPRHFCKGCQRYWTAGGALRNVPVGAGRRKAKPPCRDAAGNGLYEASSIQQFSLDEGLVLDEWHVATVAHGEFRQLFPSKRRRTSSGVCPGAMCKVSMKVNKCYHPRNHRTSESDTDKRRLEILAVTNLKLI